MRTIERTHQFKRDYKREAKGLHGAHLDERLVLVLQMLLADVPLGAKYRDHALTGIWNECRECHLWPDVLLIYQKPDADTLLLVRLGSHAVLGL